MTEPPVYDPETFRTPEDEPRLEEMRQESRPILDADELFQALVANQHHFQKVRRMSVRPDDLGDLSWQDEVVRLVCRQLVTKFQRDLVRLVPMRYPIQAYMLPNDTYVSIIAERYHIGEYTGDVEAIVAGVVEIIDEMVITVHGGRLEHLDAIAILPYIVVASQAEDINKVDTRFAFRGVYQDDLPSSKET